jgi:hypothetical protein
VAGVNRRVSSSPCLTLGLDCNQQRKCRYRQAQTRSADEPMTVRFSPRQRFPSIDMCLLASVQTFVTYARFFPFTLIPSLTLLHPSRCVNCNNRYHFSNHGLLSPIHECLPIDGSSRRLSFLLLSYCVQKSFIICILTYISCVLT